MVFAKSKTSTITILSSAGKTYDINNVPNVTNPTSIRVVGLHITFDIDPKTFALTNYTLTGFPDDLRLVTQPTVVFASKTVTLTDSQRAGSRVDQVNIDEGSAEIRISFNAGKIKYQINDAPQGTNLITTELSAAVEHVHTLGETLFYFNNPFTGKINAGNGIDAVTKKQDPVKYHHMLLAKDSPQVAHIFQGSKVSKWLVQPGGRLGGVLGEDATEIGAGAPNCTHQCQVEDQIHDGALEPVNTTPAAFTTTVTSDPPATTTLAGGEQEDD
ncbi:hypothetical protein BKA62DRAFT_682756 [Auriculariales sp. MPI-PUGE-AT-0066]|nr:hypothetical protein BKA62DRAFT_682756 [Auriculariales sp. MPI-PUGE-AT-0066]